MSNPTPRASRRVRFEEVTPAHEYAAFFNVSIAPLVAHLGLPIFDGYDDLDDLQLAFLMLPSGETVALGEYAGTPGTSLYVDVAMQHLPQIICDGCQQLRVSPQEIEWIHPDWQVEFERLYAEHDEIKRIDRSSTMLSQAIDLEPINCFLYALEIYTRPKYPEYWAMLQHNLGLAYYHRSQGERWENLQKSIDCFNKSIEVFTQDKYPEKWKINQQDLSKAQRAIDLLQKWNSIKIIINRSIPSRKLNGADLCSADLRYANLSNTDMIAASLYCRKLIGASLQRSDLRVADLRGADLSSANMSGANMSGAKLIGANLSDARLVAANMSGANLSDANLSGANLSGTNLSGAYVNNTQFESNLGISELMRQDLIARGAIFDDVSGDLSEARIPISR